MPRPRRGTAEGRTLGHLISAAGLGGIVAAVTLSLAHSAPVVTAPSGRSDTPAGAAVDAGGSIDRAPIAEAIDQGVPSFEWRTDLDDLDGLWDAVLPLLDTGEYGDAIDLFDAYLDGHPYNTAIRVERARALALAGRTGQAEWALRGILDDTGSEEVRLQLARLLFEGGRTARAIEVLEGAPDPVPAPRLYIASERSPEARQGFSD